MSHRLLLPGSYNNAASSRGGAEQSWSHHPQAEGIAAQEAAETGREVARQLVIAAGLSFVPEARAEVLARQVLPEGAERALLDRLADDLLSPAADTQPCRAAVR